MVFEKTSDWYTNRPETRALVQAIPYAGGPLDTLLSEPGRRLREERLEDFIQTTTDRLQRLEGLEFVCDSEELFDLTSQTLEAVLRTRSAEKRRKFAEIFSKQIRKGADWEEAETAIRFLKDLSELHITILEVALAAPECSPPFEGLKVVTLKDDPHGNDTEHPPLKLVDCIENYSPLAIRMACSELVSRGLFHDEGLGRYDAKSLDYLTATELGRWFKEWVTAE